MNHERLLAVFTAIGVVVGGALVGLGVTPVRQIPQHELAQSPPMGFNNWTATYCGEEFNEWMIKGVADAMVNKGLKDAGYEYVNLDDCWAMPERNAEGDLVPDSRRFPSGIKALADYIHDKGLRFGIYTSAGTKTCATNGFPGALDHEARDAALFAAWTVDLLKYDNCNNGGVEAKQRYRAMRDALDATGRPIVLSICEWGDNRPWQWADGIGHLWRTGGDIEDSWSSVLDNFGKNLAAAEYSGPGHWNDPDLLQVGNGGMTADQYRSQFSLWSIMAAPLLVGSDLRTASPETIATITNADVIAVDQDPLGKGGREVSSKDGLHVIAKPLAGGDLAVALFNETAKPALIDAKLTDMGVSSGMYVVKDLWSKSTRVETGDTVDASVSGYSTVMLRISSVGQRPSGRWNLSDVVELRSSNGWGPFQVDRSNGDKAVDDGRPLTMHGTTYRHGLGVHAPSEIVYYLGGACRTLTTTVGIDDEVQGDGSVEFRVYADDARVASSGLMRTATSPTRFTVDLAGVDTLRLVVGDGGDGIQFDHADWADPVVDCP